ncbi:MAG: hypothetical protein RMJ43_07305 [Chloroherpetonaceae bacterium]|nr:hypothetical protein [Chthonomonadaceae bacterium]MDW8207628.1 hypothetical protein [Chloroherpetonaceae bacterium]
MHIDRTDLHALLRRLNHRNERIREEAKREASLLPPEDLLQLARREVEWYRRRKKLGYAAAGIVLCLILALLAWLHRFNYGLMQLFRLIVPAFLLFLPRRGRQNVAELLDRSADPRLIGPALEMATDTSHDNHVRQMALRTITRLLPMLRADHAPLLTPRQRTLLVSLLRDPLHDPERTLLVLRALEQIGGAEAIPTVQNLAALQEPHIHIRGSVMRRWRDSHADLVRIRAAAEACLPFLHANAEREACRTTLLRAAGPVSPRLQTSCSDPRCPRPWTLPLNNSCAPPQRPRQKRPQRHNPYSTPCWNQRTPLP